VIRDINPNFQNMTVAAKTTTDYMTNPVTGTISGSSNYTMPNGGAGGGVGNSRFMHAMNEAGTFRAASDVGHTVNMAKKAHPAIVNWDDFYNYLAETRNFDLIQKRLSGPAFRDRWDQGVAIPGASSSEVWELSITQSRK
jgi:hypothetical protein